MTLDDIEDLDQDEVLALFDTLRQPQIEALSTEAVDALIDTLGTFDPNVDSTTLNLLFHERSRRIQQLRQQPVARGRRRRPGFRILDDNSIRIYLTPNQIDIVEDHLHLMEENEDIQAEVGSTYIDAGAEVWQGVVDRIYPEDVALMAEGNALNAVTDAQIAFAYQAGLKSGEGIIIKIKKVLESYYEA
jgi:hypothetical protein